MKINHITTPVSPGELLDKITILEIKSERIADADKVTNVRNELRLLETIWNEYIEDDEKILSLRQKLKQINEKLWDIEDAIRDEERHKRYGDRFIELARSVYITNDERADIKKQLNLYLNSDIVEEKSYQDYQ
ncbi:MAG: DUF6165 family protein [Gammaproteobacteria bacterium]|jgi:hypothetical protein